MTSTSHLDPEALAALDLSDQHRISFLAEDRWIDYPRARKALLELERLLASPKRTRMPSLLIHGVSNIGKSMIIQKFLRDHPHKEFNPETGMLQIDVLAVEMPAAPTERRFYGQLLLALNAARFAESAEVSVQPGALLDRCLGYPGRAGGRADRPSDFEPFPRTGVAAVAGERRPARIPGRLRTPTAAASCLWDLRQPGDREFDHERHQRRHRRHHGAVVARGRGSDPNEARTHHGRAAGGNRRQGEPSGMSASHALWHPGLPVVPPPADDELLGSWLMRISQAYGLSLRNAIGCDVDVGPPRRGNPRRTCVENIQRSCI
jgi:hypothetical protein